MGYHVGPRSQHTCRSASAPFPRGEGPQSPCVGLQCGCEGMLGGGVPGLLSVWPHFCWEGVGAAKGLLPCFLVPKGNQPTACTLALWWLKFGPTEGRGGGLGWVGSRPRLVAYPRSAPPSLRDPTGRLYPGVRSQGLPDC